MKCYNTLFKIAKPYTTKAASNLNMKMLQKIAGKKLQRKLGY